MGLKKDFDILGTKSNSLLLNWIVLLYTLKDFDNVDKFCFQKLKDFSHINNKDKKEKKDYEIIGFESLKKVIAN